MRFGGTKAGLLFALAAFGICGPAQATGLYVVNWEMLALVQVAGAQNQCFAYSYDLNGNRLSTSNVTFGATATWGSKVWSCFMWTPS